MKISEIRALVAKPLLKPVNLREKAMIAAIETLLAREAEVLRRCDAVSRISLAGFLVEDIRAILNPEGE